MTILNDVEVYLIDGKKDVYHFQFNEKDRINSKVGCELVIFEENGIVGIDNYLDGQYVYYPITQIKKIIVHSPCL